jgi:dihydroflavonol-4-reductase
VVNPTLPVGPGDWMKTPPTQMLLAFCVGVRREYIDADLNLIDVRDVAEGMMRAMADGQPGRRYLLANENLSLLEVFRQLAALTGLPVPTRRIPYPLALAFAYLDEFTADTFTHRPPVATVTGVRLTRRTMHFDPHRSLHDLGLRPRSIRQSLADTVAWFREVGWAR